MRASIKIGCGGSDGCEDVKRVTVRRAQGVFRACCEGAPNTDGRIRGVVSRRADRILRRGRRVLFSSLDVALECQYCWCCKGVVDGRKGGPGLKRDE